MLAFPFLTLLVSPPASADDGPASPRRFPLATDDALGAAILEVTGYPMDEDHPCVDRLTAPFEGVVLVGSFAYDFGCTREGYFADGVWVADPLRSSSALSLAGWSDPSLREALALAWTDLALLTGTSGWASRAVPGPRARLERDGSVSVRGFHQLELGSRPGYAVERVRVRFSTEGDATRVR